MPGICSRWLLIADSGRGIYLPHGSLRRALLRSTNAPVRCGVRIGPCHHRQEGGLPGMFFEEVKRTEGSHDEKNRPRSPPLK